jgi:chemotaxis methyl-accepting protein methylase
MPRCPLIRHPDPACFRASLQRLHQRFKIYAATSPQPLPAFGLIITPEIRLQSELYLSIKEIQRLVYRLYRQSLSHPPIFSSTLFHISLSWADCFAALPPWLQFSADPALILERLLEDAQLLERFIFHSFLPNRFNGAGFGRYPEQLDWLRQHLSTRTGSLRILDAACGSGEGTWELIELAEETGRQSGQIYVEGWTLEPLEVWAAEQQCLPHAPEREKTYQQRVQLLLQKGWGEQINFKAVDLLAEATLSKAFDVILCNGLLGGPIMHQQADLVRIATSFARLLVPEGVLLIADHFHDGWKKQVPAVELVRLFGKHGLTVLPDDRNLTGCLSSSFQHLLCLRLTQQK